jgi:hypothetical protein
MLALDMIAPSFGVTDNPFSITLRRVRPKQSTFYNPARTLFRDSNDRESWRHIHPLYVGDPQETRTPDMQTDNPPLYQLSYGGIDTTKSGGTASLSQFPLI